jgi:hypothetical protein
VQLRSAAPFVALTLAACGYSAPDEVINGQAVAAVQKVGTDFKQYTTFTVANTIQIIDNTTGTPSDPITVDAPELADAVASNMTARGFTRVPFAPGVNADLVLGMVAYKGNAVYGGYWCDWYYWGYYAYPCYPYYYGSYTFGTLVLQMADFKNAPPQVPGNTQPINNVWASAMYGILGTTAYNRSIAISSINRAFAQSPYIQR